MGFGPFSSDASTSTTVTTATLSDQAQLIGRGAKVAQGGGILFNKSNVSLGASDALLAGLVDRISTASENQIAGVLAAANQSQNRQLDALSGLLGQQRETSTGNPTLLAWVAIAAIAAFAFLMFRKL